MFGGLSVVSYERRFRKVGLDMGFPRYFAPLPRRTVILGLVVVGLAGAALTSYGLARWIHHRQIQARIERFARAVDYYAARQHLPPQLIRAVIAVESGGRPDARSTRDAIGLMQVREDTQHFVMDKLKAPDGDLTDPEYNIYIGTTYLRLLLDRFGGDVTLALAAYNWGPANVTKLLRAHPDISSVELIEAYGPAVTAAYCRGIIEESGVARLSPETAPVR